MGQPLPAALTTKWIRLRVVKCVVFREAGESKWEDKLRLQAAE
jgi:hypothetical protein